MSREQCEEYEYWYEGVKGLLKIHISPCFSKLNQSTFVRRLTLQWKIDALDFP